MNSKTLYQGAVTTGMLATGGLIGGYLLGDYNIAEIGNYLREGVQGGSALEQICSAAARFGSIATAPLALGAGFMNLVERNNNDNGGN